jgi:hypothetical protein
MPWLPLYVTADDTKTFFQLLLDENELVPIVADGVGRWIATTDKSTLLTASRSCLWHIASGPLPLLGAKHSDETTWIEDPWSGWAERRPGADRSQPYFGAGHPGIFWLDLNIYPTELPTNICGLTSFEWIGDHYKILGGGARLETHRCWKRLRSKIKKVSTKVPRGTIDGPFKPEIFALPIAAQLLQSGKRADVNSL